MPAGLPKSAPKPAKKTRRRGDYGKHRDAMAAKSRARSEKGREIGPLPEVVNPRRKARCKKDPRLFAATYFPEKFNIKFSSDHLKALALMKGCVLAGGLFALAMPRGSGKTTLSADPLRSLIGDAEGML